MGIAKASFFFFFMRQIEMSKGVAKRREIRDPSFRGLNLPVNRKEWKNFRKLIDWMTERNLL